MDCCVFFFFFQAEDGIRDLYVTGVQTCALPISPGSGPHLPPQVVGTSLRQPLDPAKQSYYRLKESRMNASLHCRGGIVSVRPRQWACLVLALLLLYNFFFAAIHASSGLDLARPASNRATVGASE